MTSAIISDCGRYRYRLLRIWDATQPHALFVMLNPSTADETQDDPTIRRCVGYAKAWGYGGLAVVNLFALRSTDPRMLVGHPDPVGPLNLFHVGEAARMAGIVVCAWGAQRFARDQADRTLTALRYERPPLHCLRLTKDGHPSHPLYLPAALRPVPFGHIEGEAAKADQGEGK